MTPAHTELIELLLQRTKEKRTVGIEKMIDIFECDSSTTSVKMGEEKKGKSAALSLLQIGKNALGRSRKLRRRAKLRLAVRDWDACAFGREKDDTVQTDNPTESGELRTLSVESAIPPSDDTSTNNEQDGSLEGDTLAADLKYIREVYGEV